MEVLDGAFRVHFEGGFADGRKCVVSVGRSGSKWMEKTCRELDIPTSSNRVDIGVRVELPAVIFSHLTDELYESKIVYRTGKFEDQVRTFCMNPNGIVVNENTNGIITVNGHSFEDPTRKTENTNFALLVSKHFPSPSGTATVTARASPAWATCWAAASSSSASVTWSGAAGPPPAASGRER